MGYDVEESSSVNCDPVQVATGNSHACTLCDTGGVVCWGANYWSELGNGTTDTDNSISPVAVTGLSGAIEISLGGMHSCALRATGEVVCWGSNAFGQLGDGSTIDSNPIRGVSNQLPVP